MFSAQADAMYREIRAICQAMDTAYENKQSGQDFVDEYQQNNPVFNFLYMHQPHLFGTHPLLQNTVDRMPEDARVLDEDGGIWLIYFDLLREICRAFREDPNNVELRDVFHNIHLIENVPAQILEWDWDPNFWNNWLSNENDVMLLPHGDNPETKTRITKVARIYGEAAGTSADEFLALAAWQMCPITRIPNAPTPPVLPADESGDNAPPPLESGDNEKGEEEVPDKIALWTLLGGVSILTGTALYYRHRQQHQ